MPLYQKKKLETLGKSYKDYLAEKAPHSDFYKKAFEREEQLERFRSHRTSEILVRGHKKLSTGDYGQID